MELKDLKVGMWLKCLDPFDKQRFYKIVTLGSPNEFYYLYINDTTKRQHTLTGLNGFYEIWKPKIGEKVRCNWIRQTSGVVERVFTDLTSAACYGVAIKDSHYHNFHLENLEPYIENIKPIEQPEPKFKVGDEVMVSELSPFENRGLQKPFKAKIVSDGSNTSGDISVDNMESVFFKDLGPQYGPEFYEYTRTAVWYVRPEHIHLIPKTKSHTLDFSQHQQEDISDKEIGEVSEKLSQWRDVQVSIKQAKLDKEHSDPYDHGSKMDEMQEEGHFTKRMTGGRYGLCGDW